MASSRNMGQSGIAPTDYARAFARIENHYFSHLGWLDSQDWIIENAGKISGIPGDIVHGKNDMICLPDAALRLSHACPKANLNIIPNAGHALSEPKISQRLLEIMDNLL